MLKHKTRHSSGNKIVGDSSELPTADLPTLRNVLAYGLLLKERSTVASHLISNQDLAKELCVAIKNIWGIVNIVIKDDRNVIKRIKSDWEMMTKISTKKAKKKDERIFKDKLDRCFNILTCRCPYVSCSEMNCAGCKNLIHICCKCPKDFKILRLKSNFCTSSLIKLV